MSEEIKIRAQSSPWYEGIQVGVFTNVNNKRRLATKVIFEDVGEGEVQQPTFHLDFRQAQILMDDLWHCGIRPTDGTGSVGQLKATEKHLEDMRKLVFDKAINQASGDRI